MSLMKIDDLFHFEKGILQSSKCTEGEFDFITASSEWKTHNEYTHNCEALVFAAAASGSLGRTHYVNGKFISSDLCFIITAKDPKKFPIDLKFYHMIFNEFKNDIVNNTKAGTSKEAIGLKAFGNYKLPYFDIEKQIETKVQFVNIQHSKIALHSELNHQLDLIKQLRQAFLREAMQGTLLPVNASEARQSRETGQQLLTKIKAEKTKLIAEKKLKKEKELPPIQPEEILFEIPENWIWCRFENLCSHIFDMEHKMPNAISNGGVMFLSAKDLIDNGKINYTDNVKHISEEDYNYLTRNFTPQKNDIIYSRRGANLGKSRIVDTDLKYLASYSCCTIRTLNPCLEYINYLLDSGFILQQAIKQTTNNSIPDLGVNKIKSFMVPLPPLDEQIRIVKKIDKIIQHCNDLEVSVKESQGYNEKLLQQVLREALQPKVETKVVSIQSRKIEKPLQTIIAGHIINLNNTTDFGRVKFQKLLYLTEYICKIDFDSHYIQKVAGPYDDILIKTIEADFNRLRFFTVVQDKTDYKRVNYNALPGAQELERSFLEYFPDESVKINNTLLKFRPLSWGECELVATLYAVWNNRIIKSEPITDDLLYNDFMAWDKQKIKYKDIFHKWLFWMKEERIIPEGWGKYIEKNIMS